jgi:hypothetical protein
MFAYTKWHIEEILHSSVKEGYVKEALKSLKMDGITFVNKGELLAYML